MKRGRKQLRNTIHHGVHSSHKSQVGTSIPLDLDSQVIFSRPFPRSTRVPSASCALAILQSDLRNVFVESIVGVNLEHHGTFGRVCISHWDCQREYSFAH